ncbi:MAG: hypothetical protein H7831_15535 [Magnetococcus sp. WYHC-3]
MNAIEQELAQKIASGEFWFDETVCFLYIPLVTLAVYGLIRLKYKMGFEWIPMLYVAVLTVAVMTYHFPGDWNAIITGWINAVSWPVDTTGLELKRNWFGGILNYVYLGLLVLVVWTTYLFDKHAKL